MKIVSQSNSAIAVAALNEPAWTELKRINQEIAAVQINLARRDPSFFVAYTMRDPLTGRYFIQDEIHKIGHNLISKYAWALYELPREHGKTEQFCIGRSVWEIGTNHNLRIKIVCSTDDEASKRLITIGRYITDNARVRSVFPELLPDRDGPWNQHGLRVQRDTISKDNSIESYGVLSSATGPRCDLLIFDDIVDFENTITNPALIDKVKEAYRNKWINILTPDGRVVYIFTRWHEKDLSHELIRQAKRPEQNPGREEFAYLRFVIDKELNPISNMWNKEKLLARQQSIGARAFARNFQGQAMAEDEAIFNNLQKCLDKSLSVSDIPDSWPKFGGVDIGGKSKERGNARNVIFTIAVNPENDRIYWLDIQMGNWNSPETAERIQAAYDKFHHRCIKVESNSYQQAIIDWIKQSAGGSHPVTNIIKAHITGTNKFREDIGLPGLSIKIDNGAVIIPHGEHEIGRQCRCSFCKAMDEFLYWPIAEFDDCVMAYWMATEAARIKEPRITVI